MPSVISAQQVEAWFAMHCSIVDEWATWWNVWESEGLNDVEPPDPPSYPMPRQQLKQIFCQTVAMEYNGDPPPAGWPY